MMDMVSLRLNVRAIPSTIFGLHNQEIVKTTMLMSVPIKQPTLVQLTLIIMVIIPTIITAKMDKKKKIPVQVLVIMTIVLESGVHSKHLDGKIVLPPVVEVVDT